MKFMIIETTYPDLKSGKKLAKTLLERKLAACVQFSEIESNYFWEEKIVSDQEILVTIKTKDDFYQKIEEIIRKDHQYEIPQIIGINIDKGSQSYLEWIASNMENKK